MWFSLCTHWLGKHNGSSSLNERKIEIILCEHPRNSYEKLSRQHIIIIAASDLPTPTTPIQSTHSLDAKNKMNFLLNPNIFSRWVHLNISFASHFWFMKNMVENLLFHLILIKITW